MKSKALKRIEREWFSQYVTKCHVMEDQCVTYNRLKSHSTVWERCSRERSFLHIWNTADSCILGMMDLRGKGGKREGEQQTGRVWSRGKATERWTQVVGKNTFVFILTKSTISKRINIEIDKSDLWIINSSSFFKSQYFHFFLCGIIFHQNILKILFSI